MCTRGSKRALLGGPSTSPLGRRFDLAPLAVLLVIVGLLGYLAQRGEKRVALAFAISPITVPVILTLWTLDFRGMLMALAAYPISLLPGIPAYLIFRRMGWLQVWSVVLTGAVLGGMAELLIFGAPNYPGAVKSLMTYCAFGTATALVFWLIAFGGLRSNNRWGGP